MLDKSLNKYSMRRKNISGYDYLLACEKESLLSLAKQKSQ